MALGIEASYQSSRPGPYNRCRAAFHFIADHPLDDGGHTALFVGATVVRDHWQYDMNRRARMSSEKALEMSRYTPEFGCQAFNLEWMPAFDDLVERIVVAWGPSARAWSQWATLEGKEVVELRRVAQEPPFPGFYSFTTTFEDIPLLYRSWCTALASVRGVYLLVHPEGDQYVGSAYGEDGFHGRWASYMENGHGDNLLLKQRGPANYSVAILEVASSWMSESDIIQRESSWKTKLGSRAHGLNAN